MDERPLDKPAHLAPVATSPMAWLAKRPAGVITAALGLLALIVVAIASGELGTTPDWRISVPGFGLTAVAAIASIAQRESGAYPLWLIGLGLAAAAMVLGWFLMVAIVIGATAIVMLILHALL